MSSGISTTLRWLDSGRAEAVGEEVVFLGSGLGELVAAGLMGDGEIDLDVAGAGGERADVAAGDDGAGEAGLGPVEVVLVAGLAVGEGDGLWMRRAAPLEKTRMPWGRGCASPR